MIGLSFLWAYAAGVALFERRIRAVALGSATCLAVAAVVAAIVLLVPRGDVGFQGAGDTSVYRTLASELRLPSTFDPTRYLALGELRQTAHTGAFYEPPSAVYHEYVRRVVGEERLRRPFLVLLPAAGILALVVILRWGTPRLRALAVACVLTAAAILVVGLAFDYRFDVYVLAEFGPRRLFDYTAIPAVLLAAAVAELGLRRLGSRAGPVALAGVVLFGAVAVPRNVASPEREAYSETARTPLAWLESNVPSRAGSWRTAGRWRPSKRSLVTRAASRAWVRTCGLRLLAVAIRSLLDARRFFADPAAGSDYLRREGIAAVVVTSYDQTLGGVGGPLKARSGEVPDMESVPFLRAGTGGELGHGSGVPRGGVGLGRPGVGLSRLPGYRCG